MASSIVYNEWKEEKVFSGKKFRVPETFLFGRKLGKGSFGKVASFSAPEYQDGVAIKQIGDAYLDLTDGQMVLREIKLMRALKHRNILRLLDVLPPPRLEHDDVYLVLELMVANLGEVIRKEDKLERCHVQFFMYQVLCAVDYIHSANVVHRDIKPGNCLVDRDCNLKICDFGLSRSLDLPQGGEQPAKLTEYIASRAYRAPEMCLQPSKYSTKIDIWAAGCILGEFLWRRPLFLGANPHDHVRAIMEIRGTPDEADLYRLVSSRRAYRFLLEQLPHYEPKPLRKLFPGSCGKFRDLIDAMLTFDPDQRPSAEQCLQHSFFYKYFDASDFARRAPCAVDWTFDDFKPTRQNLQEKVWEECAQFHPELRHRAAAPEHGPTGEKSEPEKSESCPAAESKEDTAIAQALSVIQSFLTPSVAPAR